MNNVTSMTDNSAVYTVTEIAQLLKVSPNSAYAMVRNGEIPAAKVGNRWVIPKSRFISWLNQLPDATEKS